MCNCSGKTFIVSINLEDEKTLNFLHKAIKWSLDLYNQGKNLSDLVSKVNKEFNLKLDTPYIYTCWDSHYILLLAILLTPKESAVNYSELCRKVFIKEVSKLDDTNLVLTCSGEEIPKAYLDMLLTKSNCIKGISCVHREEEKK